MKYGITKAAMLAGSQSFGVWPVIIIMMIIIAVLFWGAWEYLLRPRTTTSPAMMIILARSEEIFSKLEGRQTSHTTSHVTHRGTHPDLGNVVLIQASGSDAAILIYDQIRFIADGPPHFENIEAT